MGRTDGKRSKSSGKSRRPRTIKTYIAVRPAPPVKGQHVCESDALDDTDNDEELEKVYVVKVSLCDLRHPSCI